MPKAVVVDLDGKLGSLDADGFEERGLVGVRLEGRDRLLHPAEGDARSVPLEPDRHEPGARLQADLVQLQRRGEHERRSERRMTCERDLDRRGEDPDPRVPVAFLGQHEHRFRVVHLSRQRLEELFRDVARVGEDGDLVALERLVREDVGDHVAELGHGLSVAGTFLAPSV